jgi:hypothetical protein
MTNERARLFGEEWIAAWNAHDLDRILSHYSDDVVVTSAFVARVLGDGSVTVRGKPALRAYWARALEQFSDLTFTLFAAYPGVDSVVVHYRSIGGLVGAEFMRFDDTGRVFEAFAQYLPEADVPAPV